MDECQIDLNVKLFDIRHSNDEYQNDLNVKLFVAWMSNDLKTFNKDKFKDKVQ